MLHDAMIIRNLHFAMDFFPLKPIKIGFSLDLSRNDIGTLNALMTIHAAEIFR